MSPPFVLVGFVVCPFSSACRESQNIEKCTGLFWRFVVCPLPSCSNPRMGGPEVAFPHPTLGPTKMRRGCRDGPRFSSPEWGVWARRAGRGVLGWGGWKKAVAIGKKSRGHWQKKPWPLAEKPWPLAKQPWPLAKKPWPLANATCQCPWLFCQWPRSPLRLGPNLNRERGHWQKSRVGKKPEKLPMATAFFANGHVPH